MTLLLLAVLVVEVSHKPVQAGGPAERPECLLSMESSSAVSSLLRRVQVGNAESRGPSPQNPMIVFNWSGSSPRTTNISFVVYSAELWDTWYLAVQSEALSGENSTVRLREAVQKVNDGVIELKDRGDGSCFLNS